MKSILLGMGLASLIFGGFSQAQSSGAEPRAITPVTLTPIPEGKALVYVLNGSGRTLFGGSQTFKIDDRDAVKLGRREYSELAIAPGTHTFKAASEKLALDLEAGKYYFVMYAYRPEKSWAAPLAGSPVFFGTVTEDRARELFSEFEHKAPLPQYANAFSP
jgi:hypothetical protein